MLKGIGASPGIGIGRAFIIKAQDISYTPHEVADTDKELRRYRDAVEAFCAATEEKAVQMQKSIGEKEAEILRGHILMIRDPYMNGEIEKLIAAGQCAESALETVCDMFIQVFSSAEDELTNQRAADVRDIKDGILRILLKVEETDLSAAPPNTVLVAKELTPSMTAGIHKENISAILTETGGSTSHSAILARALEIPAVLSVPGVLDMVEEGTPLIVDGGEGAVFIDPEPDKAVAYAQKREAFLNEREALGKFLHKETVTADGAKLELLANIGTPEDALKAVDCGAEGVGLFRTEFLYMDKTSLPTEEEQFEAYKQAALIMKGKPLIIRTLDIGGDKEIPYLGLEKEENPFLGFRAVRFCLQRKELYRHQLRALLRASAFGDIRMMVPLVTCVEELRAVKALVEELKTELEQAGIAYNKNLKVGVMIETAAASQIADLLAAEADFFSIGTNDLTQYTMAVDRGNSKVAYLYSHYQPAVLRSIRHIIDCAARAQIPVGMCGEAAADTLFIPLLIAFGLDEFSVSPTSVLAARKVISLWSRQEAEKLAQAVMALTTEREVKQLLEKSKKG